MRRKILPRKKKKRVKDKNTQSTKRVMPASSTNYLTSRYFLLNLRAKHDSCPFNSLIKKNNSTAPKPKQKRKRGKNTQKLKNPPKEPIPKGSPIDP